MTTLPALSTPCTWNTFLARSTPMVLTCMWTTPSGDSLLNNHPLAHSMPGAGVVHHIIRVGLAGPRRLPVYPGGLNGSTQHSILDGEMECALMDHRLNRGFTAGEQAEL